MEMQIRRAKEEGTSGYRAAVLAWMDKKKTDLGLMVPAVATATYS
jgi:hypothetical protein